MQTKHLQLYVTQKDGIHWVLFLNITMQKRVENAEGILVGCPGLQQCWFSPRPE